MISGANSATLAERENNRYALRAVNITKDAIKTKDSKVSLHNPVSDLTDQAVLRDNAPEDFEESKFDEDPLSPSGVEENLYGQLEDQQAKMSGFQLEKESSGNNIYIGPVAQMKDSRNDSTVRQSKDQKSSNAGVPQKIKPAVKEDVFSNATTVEQKVLNDPLTKVSYLLNREANSRRNPPLESLDNKATQTKDHRISTTQYSKKIPTEVIATNAANYVPDRTRKVVAMPLRNSTDDKRIPLNSISDDNEPNLNKSESGQKHRSLPSPGRVANSQQEAVNVQLAELVQGVIDRLGNEGTKFVSLELAKHPVVKNIWANVIAQALIKQSEKLSQLDTRTNSNDSPTVSSPEAYLIPTSRNEATNNYPKVKVTADFKTKTSNGMVLTKVNQPKNKVKISNQTLNAVVHEISQKHDLNNSASATTLLGMSKPTVANSEDKPRVQSVAKQKPISQIGHTDKFPITHIPNFPDSSSVKPGTQIENTNKTINKKARNDGGIHINHTHYSIPLTDSKYFNRHGSNHPIEETKQQDLGSNLISNTTVNRIADNKNINNFEGGTQEGQREGVMTQIGYNFDSSKESSAGMEESNDLKEQYLGDKPTVENSEFSPNQRTDSSFLYNTTKLDPAETNYIQMNLMGDPVMNEEFSESGGPYASQQQLKEEDEEAKYLEQKVNDAGQIVQGLLPGLNANLSKEDSEEVRYLSDQLQDNYPYTQAQLAESFSHENDLLHAENEQNAQILSSVLKDDNNIATITNQLGNNQYQERTDSAGIHTANYTGEKLGAISRSTTLRYSNQPRNKDGATMEIESRGPMILGPRTISDISSVDLAPMRNLQGFHSSYNMNKPESSFMNEIQREGSDNTESVISGGNVARFMAQQQSIPSQDADSQAQKKRQIHTLKHTKIKSLKIRAKSSNSSSIVPVFQRRSKHAKKLSNKASLAIKPTKSHNQPAIRESEISPTSVIFGLTTNDMKELEKHLTHESNTSDGGQQAGTKREEENKKLANISLAYLMGKILSQKEFENIRGPSTKHRNIHKALHNRKYIKPSSTSPDIPFVDRKHKTRKHKRDLGSWEANTNVLNDDLDQIRDLSPKAQENLSKAIMKDYDRQLRNIKGLLNSADDVPGMKRRVLVPRLWSPKDMHTRETTQKKREVEVATEFNDGTFRSPDFEKQLSRALMKESEHDLTYLGALRDVDNHGLKTLVNEADGPSSSRTISKNMFTNPLQNDNKIGTPDNANSESIKKKQEKLRLFLQNSNHSDEGDDHWQVGEKKEWTTPGMKDSIFRDFTPESNVVSSDDKEVGSLGTDAQTQLASVLRSVHDGDQRDLNELQKMYRDDEKDVESLFTPFAGKFKRSRRKRSAFLKEGAIETIADIPDPGTEEKNLNFVVNSGMKSGKNA